VLARERDKFKKLVLPERTRLTFLNYACTCAYKK
jgi:hypothetical protein